MQPFIFSQVADQADAHTAALLDKSRFIAGGTNLLDLMKLGIERPHRLVDINALPLQTIEVLPDDTVIIGALVRNSDLAYHPVIKKHFPVLSEALLSGASPQLRNMATLGGNLLQRTRCPYFYDTAFDCNKRIPNSGCSALNGYNRSNAILGGSEHCIATHPSDMCVALTALEAVIHVTGETGKRAIPIGEFHLLPGNTPSKENVLATGDLITSVSIPGTSTAFKSHYLKVRDRASYEFALASAAVILELDRNTITKARVALGGLGTKPWRSLAAETALLHSPANETTYYAAAEAALSEAVPHRDNAFKVELARRTLARALSVAGGMA